MSIAVEHTLSNISLRRPVVALLALIAGAALFAPAMTGQARLDVLKVDYLRTLSLPGGSVQQLEEGTYYIASDGTYRIDRVNLLRGGQRTAEIRRAGDARVTALNLDTHEARVHRPAGGGMIVPPSTSDPVPSGVPGTWKRSGPLQTVHLGTKDIDGLKLEGTESSEVLIMADGTRQTHRRQFWVYRPSDRHVIPIVVATRFEMPHGTDERRVTHVSSVQISADLFNVPSNFSTVQ